MIKIFAALMLVCGALTANAADLRLTTKNTVTFRGEVTDESVAKAQRELFELAVKRGNAQYPLYLVLDTPGGDIGAGEDFIQFVRTVRDVETVTIFAASMGSAIAQGLPGKRHIVEHDTSMFHRARVGLSGQISDGEFESRLSMVKKHVERLESRNAQRLSMGLSAYKAAVKDELWLVGSDAVVRKAADEVSTLHCSIELIQKTETVMMQVFIFSVEANFSACPLLRQGKVSESVDAALLKRYNKSISDRTYFRN